MKTFKLLILLLVVALFEVKGATQAFQPIYFTNQTLNINLPLGQERMIKLPFEAKLHLQPAISNKMDVTIQGNILLIKARGAFTAGRAKIVALTQQANYPIILINFTASANNQSIQPMEIVVPELVESRQLEADSLREKQGGNGALVHPYQSLSRYALQMAFAPERLIEKAYGVRKMNTFQGYLPLYEGGAFSMRVREGYRLGKVFATVLEVSNTTSRGMDFDPRSVRGKWLARSAFVFHLKPKGDPRSTTAVVLLSNVPFEDAVGSYMRLGGEG